jgi:hypothetical protein
MLKNAPWVLFVIFFCCCTAAAAQNRDSTKVDTALLDKYRVNPGHNPLPQLYRPIQIKLVRIPVDMLDYKISYWHKALIFGLNFSQSAFTSNYAAGGISAVALGSNLDYKVEYNKKPFDYASETNLQYGVAKNQGQGSRKTNDRIFIDNKIATQLSKKWFFFGALTFESQFTAGYNYVNAPGSNVASSYLISDFMSPGYLTESLGFEYKPVKYFDLRLGTGTARQTFVLDTTIYKNLPGNYGVPIDHKLYNQLAVQIVAELDKDLTKTIHLNARYALFMPYIQPLAYTAHRLDATLTAKITRLIAMTVNTTVLYDKTSSAAIQGTEGLALGVLYKMP